MRFITALLVLASALAVAPFSNSAELKIGVVDMKRALNEYKNGQELATKVKVNADKFTEERKERYKALQELGESLGALQKKAQDPILSQAERAKAGATFTSKRAEAMKMDAEIKEFEQKRTGQLRTEEGEIRAKILEEMTKVLEVIGKEGGFNLVLDKSGVSLGTVPIVLYQDGVTDLTDTLIAKLNSAAPAAAETK